MKRVRFAPSPTGTLHVGNALSAVANRGFGDWMLLRVDDTDPARNVRGGEEAIVEDLRWLGVVWDEGPVRQSERAERHREAAEQIGVTRFDGVTLLREDGSPTYQLATVVDDIDFGITHVIRGNDHRPNEPLHRRLHEALGTEPPEYVHHGLILGDDGKKLSKRAEGATVASLREAGIPAEAVRAYLEELGIPRHDVHFDLSRVRRLAVEAIERLSDEELAARAGAEVAYAPVMRGARDLSEAREFARQVAEPEPVAVDDAETLERFGEFVDLPPRELVRELKAAGGNLRTLRLALTGRERDPSYGDPGGAAAGRGARAGQAQPRAALIPSAASLTALHAPFRSASASADVPCRRNRRACEDPSPPARRPARSEKMPLCACTRRCHGSWRSCPRRRPYPHVLLRARPSISGSTSGTHGRSSSRCGCGARSASGALR